MDLGHFSFRNSVLPPLTAVAAQSNVDEVVVTKDVENESDSDGKWMVQLIL